MSDITSDDLDYISLNLSNINTTLSDLVKIEAIKTLLEYEKGLYEHGSLAKVLNDEQIDFLKSKARQLK